MRLPAARRIADAHGFTPAQVEGLMAGIYQRGDRFMLGFLATHFVIGLLLAFYHQTWIATLTVGTASLGTMILLVWIWPGRFFTRAMASIAQQAFVALHIYQLSGQSEQHFWFFTALTVMIIYQDWVCMWPGTLLIILQHILFAVLHDQGYPVHFFPEAHVGFTKLFYHFGIAIVQVGICGYFAHLLRLQTLSDAWRKYELARAGERLAEELLRAQASERALAASTELLHESSQRQRAILENTGDLAWVKDTQGRYVAANPAMAAAIGRRVDEVEGHFDHELFTGETLARIKADDRAIIANAQPFRAEQEFTSASGQPMIIEWVITPVVADDGAVTGITGLGRDVSVRKRVEEERVQLEAKVQHAQKLESLGVLAGGVAHDFNNLLVAILGNISLARREIGSDAPSQALLEDAEHASQQAAGLINLMLAYSGKGQLVMEPLSLTNAARELTPLLAAGLSKKAARIDLLTDDVPSIVADAAQIRQVMMNLLTNASDALEDRPGTITLTTGAVTASRAFLDSAAPDRELPAGLYAFFSVEDTGVGMDAATLQRMFDPFFTTKVVGRGLGLAAVQGIIRGHHGVITVASRVGEGTKITVFFPAVPLARPAVAATTEPGGAAAGHRTILVVDDEEKIRSFVSRALERSGYDVAQAADGVEALALVRSNPQRYDCVILDLTMPRMNGEQTQLELERSFPDLPVIISTGFSGRDTDQRFAGRRVAGFLPKPYTVSGLLAAVQAALGQNALASGRAPLRDQSSSP